MSFKIKATWASPQLIYCVLNEASLTVFEILPQFRLHRGKKGSGSKAWAEILAWPKTY